VTADHIAIWVCVAALVVFVVAANALVNKPVTPENNVSLFNLGVVVVASIVVFVAAFVTLAVLSLL
jgi:hypothetical protein